MFHTLIRTIRRFYPGVVFGGYLLAFFLAFVMIFMLPIGSLALVLLGVLGLIPVVIGLWVVRAIERPLALGKLRRGICPVCGLPTIEPPLVGGSDSYRCTGCAMRFSARGEEVPPADEVNSTS
ncbi:MAG: hypothetical protein EXS01_04885 [Phycisphaerales bacterium]|nr:hypothetical protein [Phycisphaerales bacterium]